MSDIVDDFGRHGVISDHWMDLLLWWHGFLLSEDPANSTVGYFQVYSRGATDSRRDYPYLFESVH